ncbi:MAG: COG2426 family protein [Actinomycetota bacterium]
MAEELLSYIPVLRDLPPAVTVALVATLPVIELRGAIPLGVLLGLSPLEAALPAVIGNLIPVPALVWWLDPVQRWLSERSRGFARFFEWLFSRTRKRGGERYERFRDLALILFVAVPLPGTGAWTGAAGAFVFGIKGWKAFFLIAIGVLLAAAAVTAFTTAGKAVVDRAIAF